MRHFIVLILTSITSFTFAQNDSSKVIMLENVVIIKSIDASNLFSKIDVQLKPVNSSQDLLRIVPGLFIGQHAGGGKAEQIFLRGFDIDHGTDLNISVDNMPVNMVSHAHGQGYADLHFLIPETLESINYSKGSYKAEQGNFATAGSVGFMTKEKLEKSSVSFEMGQFNQKRALGLINLTSNDNINAYLASEYLYNDGPFESPQALNRLNLMGKITRRFGNYDKLSISASHFKSRWDASGQIPQRAVDTGLIGRFGAIDNTEGGNTSRQNLNIAYYKNFKNKANLESRAYFTHYDFLLFSNFTFFAQNLEKGDQIKQKENRNLFGLSTRFSKDISLKEVPFLFTAELGLRNDLINANELSRTFQKTTNIENIKLGVVNELNTYLNTDLTFQFNKWSIIPGLRADVFNFQYNNRLNAEQSSLSQVLLSPKVSFLYQQSDRQQFYLKAGTGYHSNDSRSVVLSQNAVPRSLGTDLGTILKPNSKFLLHTTFWYLYLQQEFVYVGDEGIVEPSGRTQRLGVDVSARYQFNSYFFFDTDATYAHARSIDDASGQNFIPLAPIFTFTGGVSMVNFKRFSGGIHSRILGKRPANEDYSLTAKGYAILDANLSYAFKKAIFGLEIQNVLNSQWNETQFATASRLRGEKDITEEIHFTPGTPFMLRAKLSFGF